MQNRHKQDESGEQKISHEELFGADHPLLKRKDTDDSDKNTDDTDTQIERSSSAKATEWQRQQMIPGGVPPKETIIEEPRGPEKDKGFSKTARIVEYVFRGAFYLTVFLTPLFFFSSSDVLGFSKSILLSVLALVLIASWAGKVIASGKATWRSHWFLWSVPAIGVVVLLSNLFSSSFWVSFLGVAGRYDFATVTVLSYLVIFLAIVANVRGKEIMRLVWALAASNAFLAVLTLLKFAGLSLFPAGYAAGKFFSPVGSVFSLTLFVGFMLPIVITLFSMVKQRRLKAGLLVLGFLNLAILLLVNFRTAWLVLAISMLVYLAFTITRNGFAQGRWHYRRFGTPLVLLIVALLFWLFPNVLGIGLSGAPVEISPSFGASVEVVRGSWSQNLLLGSGPETFPYEYSQYKSADLNRTNFWGVNFNNGNSEILTWLSNHGLLGGIALLVFIGWFIVLAFRELRNNDSQFLIGLFAGWVFIVASKFFYPTNITLELYLWVLPALYLAYSGKKNSSLSLRVYEFRTGSLKTLAIFIVSLVLVVASLGGLYLSAQRWAAERSYTAVILEAGTPENRDERITTLNRAILLNSRVSRYWQTLSQVLILKVDDTIGVIQARAASGDGSNQASQQETAQIQRLTVQVFGVLQQARQLDPENVSLLINVAETYKRTSTFVSGANDLAIEVYEQTVELEPINPFLHTQLAQLYLVKENFFLNQQVRGTELIEKAKTQLARAIDLNPNYSNARYFMGFILDREGDQAGALEQFERVLVFNQNSQVIQLIVQNLRSGLSVFGPPPPAEPENAPVESEEAQGIPE